MFPLCVVATKVIHDFPLAKAPHLSPGKYRTKKISLGVSQLCNHKVYHWLGGLWVLIGETLIMMRLFIISDLRIGR